MVSASVSSSTCCQQPRNKYFTGCSDAQAREKTLSWHRVQHNFLLRVNIRDGLITRSTKKSTHTIEVVVGGPLMLSMASVRSTGQQQKSTTFVKLGETMLPLPAGRLIKIQLLVIPTIHTTLRNTMPFIAFHKHAPQRYQIFPKPLRCSTALYGIADLAPILRLSFHSLLLVKNGKTADIMYSKSEFKPKPRYSVP